MLIKVYKQIIKMEIPTIYAEEHLSEHWFTLISLGLKTYEGRLHKNRFKLYKLVILFLV